MKKAFIIFTITFVAGFLTHAFFFPEFLSNGIVDVGRLVIPIPAPTGSAKATDKFETIITFDGDHFSRHNIAISVGNYLMIRNVAMHHLMWLSSNDPQLATVRGYAESEQVRERMDTKGQFLVQDKNNPSERLIITVK